MKKLLLLLLLIVPLSASASPANTSFWGWVSYMETPNTYDGGYSAVWSWKLYHVYKCKIQETYLDWDVAGTHRKDFDRDDYVVWTMDRVYCKVRDYQCSCIYK